MFARAPFQAYIATLPHAFIVHQWGEASVAKVGSPQTSKIFAILSSWDGADPAISFKCSELSFQILSETRGVRPAPYLARAGWVQVRDAGVLEPDHLQAYIAQAHKLIFEKLPLRLRGELERANGDELRG